jgi:fibronectin-binding autotransporter adhesin
MKPCITTSPLLAVRLASLTKALILRHFLVSTLLFMTLPAHAIVRQWTGAVSANWSHPNNWNPAGLPANGDDLIFDLPSPPLLVNDLTGLTVRLLSFRTGSDFDLLGNSLTILERISLAYSSGDSYTVTIACPLTLGSNVVMNVLPGFDFFANPNELHVTGPINLNGYDLSLYTVYGTSGFQENNSEIHVSGVISGMGNVRAYPAKDGTVAISGSAGNTFTGTLFVEGSSSDSNPGRLHLNKSSGVAVNDRLEVFGRTVLDRDNQIGDGASVLIGAAQDDSPYLDFQGHNDTFTSLTLSNNSWAADAVYLDSGGGVCTILGNISSHSEGVTPLIKGKLSFSSGSHDIHVNGSIYEGLDIQAQMSGFGNFSKSGNSALLLTASNSFNSTISILQGVLDVRHNHALGDIAGSTQIFEGNLTLRNVNIGAELLFALGGTGGEFPGSALTSVGISTWAGQVALYTNLVVTGDMTFTGPISGTGGMGCFGGGTIRFDGSLPNTYTGTTLVRCPLVEFNKSYDVKAFSGALIVGGPTGGPYEARWLNYYQSAGTSLTLHANGLVNLNNTTERFDSITFNGGQIDSGPFGICMLGNPVNANPSYLTVNAATTPAIINGYFQPAGGAAWITTSNGVADPDLLINAGVVGNAPQIIKQGAGSMRLASAGNYSGVTIVNEGTLDVGHNTALGSASFGTIVNEAATLRLSSFGTVPEGFALSGTGVGGTNGVVHVTGNPTVTGASFLNGPSTINVAPGAGLAVDSVISGTGPLTKTGPGNLFLGGVSGGVGNNTYSGSTIVSAGTLYLSKNQNALSVPGPLVVGPATIGAPATARFSRSGTMPAAGTVTVNANSLLDLNNNNQTLASLHLNDGGDVQTGTGQLNFPAGGGVTVGTLNAPQVGLLASSSISGKLGLPVLDYLTLNVGGYGPASLVPDAELVIPAVISGGGNIIKNGAGTMLLSGANTFNDSPPNVAGDLYIYGGAVIAANPLALGGPAGWTLVYNGACLALVGGISINNETLYLNTTNLAGLDNRGGHNTWFGPINQARDSGIGVNQDWSLTVQGTISGTGNLTKRGAGLLRLGGAANNTHSGDTFVDAGALWLTKPPNMQAVPANLIIGRPAGGSSATVMHVNTDQIWGNITVNNGGLLNLNGYDEYSGILTLNGGGDVQTGAGTLYPFTSVSVNPGGFADQSVITGHLGLFPGLIPFNIGSGSLGAGNADCLVSAVIGQHSTAAGLLKNGSGRLRLTGNNTYVGQTYINEGTLQIDGVQPQSPVTLDHETHLQGSGTVGDVLLNGGATTIAPGTSPGTLTCSNLIASGGNGTLQIELNGTTPSSTHDQINVRGTVDLLGLKLNASLGFNSAVSDQFTIINNDGSDAVTGTFTGLPQNKKVYVGSELFQINYTGGTGNDVVLTRLVTPPPPTLTIQRVSPASVRLLWPTNDPTFSLQSNTNLNSTNWIAATPLPSVSNTNHVVTNTISGSAKFYRLSNP